MKLRRIERMDELIDAAGFHLFYREPWINPRTGEPDPRVSGFRPDYRFLVARDEWDRTFAPILTDEKVQRLEYGGWPVEPDDSLGPGSVVFVEQDRDSYDTDPPHRA